MDRERVEECRWIRDISAVRQDLFGACFAQCEIVELLRAKADIDIYNTEIQDEWDNLQECIKDCIYLFGIEVDEAFCNGLYHEFALVKWKLSKNERYNREEFATHSFLETENDYFPAKIFHTISFQRMKDDEKQEAMERYYKLLKHRWSDSERTAEAVFTVLVYAILPNNVKLYYHLFQQYNILLKYLYSNEEYGPALFGMASASCICKDRTMVYKCRKCLEQWFIERNKGGITILEEVELIYVDALLDWLDNKYDSQLQKCKCGIKN